MYVRVQKYLLLQKKKKEILRNVKMISLFS